MHMQSNNDEKNIDFLTHLQEKLPLKRKNDISQLRNDGGLERGELKEN